MFRAVVIIGVFNEKKKVILNVGTEGAYASEVKIALALTAGITANGLQPHFMIADRCYDSIK